MADTTLTAAQSGDRDDTGYLLASVAGDGPRNGDFLIQIDDEFEYVEWRGDQHTRPWQVRRGYLGTTPADHDSGATVSVEPSLASGGGGSISATDGTTTMPSVTSLSLPAGTLSDLGAGVAGVGLVLSQLGPFHVTYQTADITGSPGAIFGDIPAGAIVLKAWLAVTTTWTSDNEPEAGVGICKADGSSAVDLVDYNSLTPLATMPKLGNADFAVEAVWADNSGLLTTQVPITATAIAAGKLFIYVLDSSGGALTAGAGDLYAIIATPAS